jgi:sarcosine oxidase subunit beta
MNHPDIIIIGAGLMGASSALNLARDGKKVVLLEKESSGIHASAVNAGGVRRLNRAFAEIPISAAAGEMWHQLSKIVGDDCGFHAVGQVRIGPGEKEMKLLSDRVAQVEALGFLHEELIDTQEVKRLVPAYRGSCRGGIVARSDGYAQPARTLRAFISAAKSEGVELHNQCRITAILNDKDGFRVKAGDGRQFRSEVVVNCAGAWGKHIAALIGDDLPIEPAALTMMVTGRMKRFLTPVVGIEGQKLSFKQMANGTVVIGGAHRAALDMKTEKNTVKVSAIKKSSETVMQHFPIMAKSIIVRCWAGIEGMVADGLPIIDASPDMPGFFHVCGFSAHGFQLSPMIGRLVASLAQAKKPELSLDAFSLGRFKKSSRTRIADG